MHFLIDYDDLYTLVYLSVIPTEMYNLFPSGSGTGRDLNCAFTLETPGRDIVHSYVRIPPYRVWRGKGLSKPAYHVDL
ncbi:MAG: hypothetical protein P8Y60_19010, partial [Calditrichota bacterium]